MRCAILIPKGTYVPVFERRTPRKPRLLRAEQSRALNLCP